MDEGSEFKNNDLDEDTESGFYRVIQVLLRLLVVVIVGAGIGAGAYFGVPALYREFIEPVQENTRRITDLEAALTLEQDKTRRQAEQTGEQLDNLEVQLGLLEDGLDGLQDAVEGLQTVTSDLTQVLDEQTGLPDRVQDLTSEMITLAAQLDDLEERLDGIAIPALRLERQMDLLRVMTLLTRARLWLVQDNLGTAAEDVESARNILSTLVGEEEQDADPKIQEIIERLDLALEDIRSAPVVAADELEIAWKLLVSASGVPQEQVIEVVEPITEEGSEDESQ